MNQWFIKTFHKKEAVRVFIVTRDKKLEHKYVLPDKEGNFTIGKETFIIDDNPYYSKGFPTYIFKYDNVGPVNINPGINGVEASKYTPKHYNTGIHNNLARTLFSSSDEFDKQSLSMILSIVTIAIVVAVGVFLYNEIANLSSQISNIIGR